MYKASNQRDLRDAVARLARTDVSEADVSRAIDCFGQVLADLTGSPLRLAVITGEALQAHNELRAEVDRLKIEVETFQKLTGVEMRVKPNVTFAGFKLVEDPSMRPNEVRLAYPCQHAFLNGTCVNCGVVHWSE